jgi:hypothetical protein
MVALATPHPAKLERLPADTQATPSASLAHSAETLSLRAGPTVGTLSLAGGYVSVRAVR